MGMVHLAVFTLKEYCRANWLYMETFLVAVLLFFYGKEYWMLGTQDVFPILSFFALAAATLTTLRITGRETNTRIYILLTKKLSRCTYLCGKALAIFLLDGLYILGLFVLTFKFTKVSAELTLIESLIHLIPVFLVLILAESVFLFFSALVLRNPIFLVGLILVILGVNHPSAVPVYFFLPIQQLIKSSYMPGGLSTETGLLAIFFIAFFFALACWVFSSRELDYKSK